MGRRSKYAPEVRERTARLVLKQETQHDLLEVSASEPFTSTRQKIWRDDERVKYVGYA